MFDETLGSLHFSLMTTETLLGTEMTLVIEKALTSHGRSQVVGVRTISMSVRTAPNVYQELGDCGGGGRDELLLLVCVVLFCDLLYLQRKPTSTERLYSPMRNDRPK